MAAVRMGEMQISSAAGEELVAIGLGSCIGLALVDQRAGVAAVAHIVLPESQGIASPAGKYADLAVPEIVREIQRAGAAKTRLQVAIVGGAKMFAVGPGLDIGARNRLAVREALAAQHLRVDAEMTGGGLGRTLRVHVGTGTVTVQEAGGSTRVLLAPARAAEQACARLAGGPQLEFGGANA